ncbi:hypothetical protein PV433_25875 [Paenibacillus sp. GYB004]|uniref:LPD38 domain-containing protein n=1 Tax=Paenibacillus sp. GYB004 TaxID=2994393 RepID=UPI002F968875
MALISPEEFKKSRGLSSTGGGSGSGSSGLIPPSEFIRQRAAPVPEPEPLPAPSFPLPSPDVRNSSLMQTVGQAASTPSAPVQAAPNRPHRPHRDVPVVGAILRGLDAVADNKVVGKIGEIGRSLYTPGGGIGNIASFTGAVGNTLNRLLPKLGSSTGGRVAQEAIKEGLVGVPLATGQALTSQTSDLGEAAKQGLIGGALGAAGGAAFTAGGAALARTPFGQRLLGLSRQAEPEPALLGLPEPRQRGNVNQAVTPDVIADPYTFPLPEATPGTVRRAEDTSQAFAALNDIDDQARQLEIRRQEAINNEYKFLKESRDSRGGVKQGGLIQNADGEVTGRFGRMSENPKWYQDFYAEHGKAPSNKDLMDLARKRVDEGFEDAGFSAPAWRTENAYDETLQGLGQARNTLRQSLQERVLNPTDARLTASVMKSNRVPDIPEAPPAATPEPPLPEIPTPTADSGPLGISAFGGKKGKFTNPEDTRTYIATKTDKEPVDFADRVNQFYESGFDNLQRINQFDKTVEKVTGQKLGPEDRSYMQALNQRGADMTARTLLTEQLVDSRGEVIGPSLKSITQQIPRRSYTNFMDYLIAKHAETRMPRGEKVYDKRTNMTPEKVAAKIEEYERTYPEFKNVADQLYDWNTKMAQAWLVDTGIVSPGTLKAWKEENPFWIPNKRQFTELERRQRATGAKRGFANQNNPVKSYAEGGSERPIIDPIESLIEYTDRYVKTARRNEVMQTVVRNLEKAPEDLDGFATVLKREKVDPKTALGEEGPDSLLDSLDDEFDKVLRKSDLDKDNVVSAIVNGERVYVRVEDPALLDALTNLGPQADNAVMAAMRKATNAVKMLTTGVNPVFSLTRNIFRDIPAAFIFSKTTNNPFRFAIDMLDGIVSTLGNKDLYRRYKSLGGGHSSPVAADRNLLAQSKREILPQQKEGLGLIPRAYSALENLSNVIESAPRLGEFKRVTKAGGDSYGSRIEGIYEANDITTNFKRHGTATKQADAILLYLNAALQGLDKTVRAFKDNPKAVAAKAAGAISVPTIALYALNYNNPEYEKLSNYTKDNFYLIPTGSGEHPFIKIPRPRELGVPFAALLERTMRAWFEEDPESFRDFSETVSTAFAPPGIPAKELLKGELTDAGFAVLGDTIGGGFAELGANKNFAGAPIVPGYLEGLSPRYQFDANTSEPAKFVGDLLNQSPKKIDHLIRSYTGVIGQLGLPATTQGATVGGTLAKQMTADPVFSTDATKVFYELKEKLDTQYADVKATGEVPRGYDDAARKYINQVAGEMSEYTKAIRAVDMSDLPSAEKKSQKRELTEERNEMARRAYAAVREAIKQSSAK